MKPLTLAQKLIARASGRPDAAPGDVVMCKIDLAMSHDSSGPRRVGPMLDKLGASVKDAAKYVVITDHFVPPADAASESIIRFTREWVAEKGIANFHDEQGICHVVLPERGHVRPGMFIVGGDSHSTTAGAFGTYAFGIGATEMAGAIVTGEIWLQVPETLLIEWSDRLPDGVCAKDMMLFPCRTLGMNGGNYQAVEYAGEAVRALPMQERMTLCNMTAELGAQVGLIAPDAVTKDYLENSGAFAGGDTSNWSRWRTDPGAALLAHHKHDAARLAPQVAAPHSPANARDIGETGRQSIDIAYIGACTGAKLEDMRMAARVLKGRKASPSVRLMLAPASVRDRATAEAEGTLGIIRDAGAVLLPASCGSCAGYGGFLFPDDSRAISSTARNFKGRMGSTSSRVWLASPYTVAASAVTGVISDPREFLS